MGKGKNQTRGMDKESNEEEEGYSNHLVLSNFVLNTKQFNPATDEWAIYKEKLAHLFNITKVRPEEKVSVLITVLSPQAYKLLRNLTTPDKPETKTFKELCVILDQHYVPSQNRWNERQKFMEMTQNDDESVNGWYARVMESASKCEFGAEISELLKYKFITGLRKKIFQRLAEEKEVDLPTALQLAQASENKATFDQTVNVVTPNRSSQSSNTQHQAKTAQSSSNQFRCYRCNKSGHSPNMCRYKTYKCSTCGKIGHLSEACRQRGKQEGTNNKSNRTTKQNDKPRRQQGNNSTKHINTVGVEDKLDNKILIENVNKPIVISLSILGKSMQFELDSGAGISAIPAKTFNTYFKGVELKKSVQNVTSFSGESLNCIGYFNVPIEYKNKNSIIKMHVIENATTKVLGRDFFHQFDICFSILHVDNQIELNNELKLKLLLEKHSELFKDELGMYKYKKISLDISENARPKFWKPRQVPFAKRDIDYKVTLNPHLKDFNHPLPRIEDIFASLHGGKIFCKLDVKQAFMQCLLDERSQMLCALSTDMGIYKVLRMPYGIKVATSIFQQEMEKIISGLKGIAAFVDDILVAASSADELLERLEALFDKLSQAGIRLNKNKCVFLADSIEYLGHTINSKGLSKNMDRVKAFLKTSEPRNVSEVKAFCGVVNYYSKFIEGLAEIMSPIYNLLKKEVIFDFNSKCKESFDTIKSKIAEDITLAHFDLNSPLVLTTDASKHSIAGVLSTVKEGRERPISFISRRLNKSEKNYSVVDKEALAIIYAFKKLRLYLIGRKFELRTDQKSLLRIFDPDKETPVLANERLKRWSSYISGYDFKIKHIPGKENIADPLSRLSNSEDQEFEEEVCQINFLGEKNHMPVSKEDIFCESKKDPLLKTIFRVVKQGSLNKLKGDKFSPFSKRSREISIKENILFWGDRVIVPQKLQAVILEELHSPHMGMVKTKSIARQYFWWPSMNKAIENRCKNCESCKLNTDNPPKAELVSWPIPIKSWSRVHMDYAGPKWSHWFLVIVDSKSKWLEVFKTKQATSQFTRDKLRETFARHGLCDVVVSDNGSVFKSKELEDFFSSNGIDHRTTPTYFPQNNGQAENSQKRGYCSVSRSQYEY
ncbi:uncharacterized protein K02A2.6-like [Eupeodes corollae]|uniref:uncharacterized protein K02A2.6-like n=1 Tax=Eupeodes corollae TaxID=290404 RepID=UPI0024929CFF|nr:uncharacterized protein K02A2.6-like [Eupeodes corollae]